MTATPLVTVVTPVMNRAETLPRCLASVASQTYPNVEHLVIDGGSSDGTQAVLKDWERRHSLRWTSEPDDGMYDAINKGLRMATGSVLTYLNSDDLWFPWTLEVAVDHLSNGADMVFGDLALISSGAAGQSLWLQFYRPFTLNYYTYVKALGQPTVAWHRRVTDDLGLFDDSYRLIGDCEYWLRAGASGYRLEHVGDVQAVQYEHEGTLRSTQAEQLKREFVRLRETFGPVAGRPGNAELRRVIRSLEWRFDQFRLHRELGRRTPRRWARFIDFVRTHDLPVDRRKLLLFQLPAAIRPGDAGWLDPIRFEAELDEAISLP